MKSKINSPDESCFNLPTGYSIDMIGTANIPFGIPSYLNSRYSNTNNWNYGYNWWSNL